jgi:hypothetical protein
VDTALRIGQAEKPPNVHRGRLFGRQRCGWKETAMGISPKVLMKVKVRTAVLWIVTPGNSFNRFWGTLALKMKTARPNARNRRHTVVCYKPRDCESGYRNWIELVQDRVEWLSSVYRETKYVWFVWFMIICPVSTGYNYFICNTVCIYGICNRGLFRLMLYILLLC